MLFANAIQGLRVGEARKLARKLVQCRGAVNSMIRARMLEALLGRFPAALRGHAAGGRGPGGPTTSTPAKSKRPTAWCVDLTPEYRGHDERGSCEEMTRVIINADHGLGALAFTQYSSYTQSYDLADLGLQAINVGQTFSRAWPTRRRLAAHYRTVLGAWPVAHPYVRLYGYVEAPGTPRSARWNTSSSGRGRPSA